MKEGVMKNRFFHFAFIILLIMSYCSYSFERKPCTILNIVHKKELKEMFISYDCGKTFQKLQRSNNLKPYILRWKKTDGEFISVDSGKTWHLLKYPELENNLKIVFENIAKNKLVFYSDINSFGTIEIFNMLGQTVIKKSLQFNYGKNEIELSSPSFYGPFLVVIYIYGKIFKTIIQHD